MCSALRYVGTNRDGVFLGPQTGRDLGKDALVVSLSKTF